LFELKPDDEIINIKKGANGMRFFIEYALSGWLEVDKATFDKANKQMPPDRKIV
jgi:hypothetical protein